MFVGDKVVEVEAEDDSILTQDINANTVQPRVGELAEVEEDAGFAVEGEQEEADGDLVAPPRPPPRHRPPHCSLQTERKDIDGQ